MHYDLGVLSRGSARLSVLYSMDRGTVTANDEGCRNDGKTQYKLVRDQCVAELALAIKPV
jgi:hypothetical protein